MWSDTYERELREGSTFENWVLTPFAAVALLAELVLAIGIADDFLTTDGGWRGAVLAIVVGLVGPLGAASGWSWE